jgi:glycosyltransferase involved in cell wall biosynthesis
VTCDVAVVFPAANRRGGVERIAYDLCRYLADRGMDVAFVGCEWDDGRASTVRHVAVDLARGRSRAFAFRRAAARALRDLEPRVTVSLGANCPPGDVYLVQSVHRSWLRSAKTVPVLGRDVPAAVRYLMPRHVQILALERAYFRSARPRAVICCSERERQDAHDLYGVASDRLHVVPNGFDHRVFHVGRRDERGRRRAELGLDDASIALLFMANELHRKGFAQLLRAVATAGGSFRIEVVGRADIAPYASEIDRLGLSGRVRWHGPTDDAAGWYAACDLLVLPTQYEPFGLVIVESLATGLPVITTRLAGAADAVEPGFNGLLQNDPHDVGELAGLLIEASDATTRERWVANAPGSVDRFQQQRVFAAIVDLFGG